MAEGYLTLLEYNLEGKQDLIFTFSWVRCKKLERPLRSRISARQQLPEAGENNLRNHFAGSASRVAEAAYYSFFKEQSHSPGKQANEKACTRRADTPSPRGSVLHFRVQAFRVCALLTRYVMFSTIGICDSSGNSSSFDYDLIISINIS